MMNLENTEGYTQNELDKLNAEFEERFKNGDWGSVSTGEAEKWFSDEVAGR